MNRLLALADFSAASEAALRYAAAVAAAHNMPLTLLHAYVLPVAYTPDEMVLPLMPAADTRNTAAAQLDESLARLQAEFPAVSMDGQLLYGDVESALAPDQDIAIDGHTVFLANDTANSSWLSGDTPTLLRNIPRTVLAVPEGAVYRTPTSIGLALDPARTYNLPLEPLLDWIRLTGARLHVVCIGTGERPLPDAVTQALAPVAPVYHWHSVSDSVEAGLQTAVGDLQLDWLALTPHPHGVLASLFRRGHTKELAQQVAVPLLALHVPAV